MSKSFIDFSQFQTMEFCEAKWVERYLHQVAKAPPPGQREDALTLGTLVHAGLQALRETGTPAVPEAVVAQANCTPECLGWARALLAGYVQRYPQEEFKTFRCEAPLRFPLRGMDIEGLAKVDYYFQVIEPTELASGLGDHYVLEPGWWVKEYKTKDASRHRGNYIDGWKAGMQATFQMLALREHLGEAPRGVLIDVLEKPKPYIPERTCKGCKTVSEYRNWAATGDGFACPLCGNLQKLDPPKEGKPRIPDYYRLMVIRSAEELEWGLGQIESRASRMQDIRSLGYLPNHATERCVDGTYGRCEYFEPHTVLRPASGSPGFVTIDAYVYVKEPDART